MDFDFEKMKRKELQALCKKHHIPANTTNLEMTRALLLLTNILNNNDDDNNNKKVSDVQKAAGPPPQNVVSKKVRFCLQRQEEEDDEGNGKLASSQSGATTTRSRSRSILKKPHQGQEEICPPKVTNFEEEAVTRCLRSRQISVSVKDVPQPQKAHRQSKRSNTSTSQQEEEEEEEATVPLEEINQIPILKPERVLRRSSRNASDKTRTESDIEIQEAPIMKKEAKSTLKPEKFLRRSQRSKSQEEEGKSVFQLEEPRCLRSRKSCLYVDNISKLEDPPSSKPSDNRASKRKSIALTDNTFGRNKCRKQSGKLLEAGILIHGDNEAVSEFEQQPKRRSSRNICTESLAPLADKKITTDESMQRNEAFHQQEQPLRRSKRNTSNDKPNVITNDEQGRSTRRQGKTIVENETPTKNDNLLEQNLRRSRRRGSICEISVSRVPDESKPQTNKRSSKRKQGKPVRKRAVKKLKDAEYAAASKESPYKQALSSIKEASEDEHDESAPVFKGKSLNYGLKLIDKPDTVDLQEIVSPKHGQPMVDSTIPEVKGLTDDHCVISTEMDCSQMDNLFKEPGKFDAQIGPENGETSVLSTVDEGIMETVSEGCDSEDCDQHTGSQDVQAETISEDADHPKIFEIEREIDHTSMEREILDEEAILGAQGDGHSPILLINHSEIGDMSADYLAHKTILSSEQTASGDGHLAVEKVNDQNSDAKGSRVEFSEVDGSLNGFDKISVGNNIPTVEDKCKYEESEELVDDEIINAGVGQSKLESLVEAANTEIPLAALVEEISDVGTKRLDEESEIDHNIMEHKRLDEEAILGDQEFSYNHNEAEESLRPLEKSRDVVLTGIVSQEDGHSPIVQFNHPQIGDVSADYLAHKTISSSEQTASGDGHLAVKKVNGQKFSDAKGSPVEFSEVDGSLNRFDEISVGNNIPTMEDKCKYEESEELVDDGIINAGVGQSKLESLVEAANTEKPLAALVEESFDIGTKRLDEEPILGDQENSYNDNEAEESLRPLEKSRDVVLTGIVSQEDETGDVSADYLAQKTILSSEQTAFGDGHLAVKKVNSQKFSDAKGSLVEFSEVDGSLNGFDGISVGNDILTMEDKQSYRESEELVDVGIGVGQSKLESLEGAADTEKPLEALVEETSDVATDETSQADSHLLPTEISHCYSPRYVRERSVGADTEMYVGEGNFKLCWEEKHNVKDSADFKEKYWNAEAPGEELGEGSGGEVAPVMPQLSLEVKSTSICDHCDFGTSLQAIFQTPVSQPYKSDFEEAEDAELSQQDSKELVDLEKVGIQELKGQFSVTSDEHIYKSDKKLEENAVTEVVSDWKARNNVYSGEENAETPHFAELSIPSNLENEELVTEIEKNCVLENSADFELKKGEASEIHGSVDSTSDEQIFEVGKHSKGAITNALYDSKGDHNVTEDKHKARALPLSQAYIPSNLEVDEKSMENVEEICVLKSSADLVKVEHAESVELVPEKLVDQSLVGLPEMEGQFDDVSVDHSLNECIEDKAIGATSGCKGRSNVAIHVQNSETPHLSEQSLQEVLEELVYLENGATSKVHGDEDNGGRSPLSQGYAPGNVENVPSTEEKYISENNADSVEQDLESLQLDPKNIYDMKRVRTSEMHSLLVDLKQCEGPGKDSLVDAVPRAEIVEAGKFLLNDAVTEAVSDFNGNRIIGENIKSVGILPQNSPLECGYHEGDQSSKELCNCNEAVEQVKFHEEASEWVSDKVMIPGLLSVQQADDLGNEMHDDTPINNLLRDDYVPKEENEDIEGFDSKLHLSGSNSNNEHSVEETTEGVEEEGCLKDPDEHVAEEEIMVGCDNELVEEFWTYKETCVTSQAICDTEEEMKEDVDASVRKFEEWSCEDAISVSVEEVVHKQPSLLATSEELFVLDQESSRFDVVHKHRSREHQEEKTFVREKLDHQQLALEEKAGVHITEFLGMEDFAGVSSKPAMGSYSSNASLANATACQGYRECTYDYEMSSWDINLFSEDNVGNADTSFIQNIQHEENVESKEIREALSEDKIKDTNEITDLSFPFVDRSVDRDDQLKDPNGNASASLMPVIDQDQDDRDEKDARPVTSLRMPFAIEEADVQGAKAEITEKQGADEGTMDEINRQLTKMYISSAIKKRKLTCMIRSTPKRSVKCEMKENMNMKMDHAGTPIPVTKRRALEDLQNSTRRKDMRF